MLKQLIQKFWNTSDLFHQADGSCLRYLESSLFSSSYLLCYWHEWWFKFLFFQVLHNYFYSHEVIKYIFISTALYQELENSKRNKELVILLWVIFLLLWNAFISAHSAKKFFLISVLFSNTLALKILAGCFNSSKLSRW